MDTYSSLGSTCVLNVQTPSLSHQIFDLRRFRRNTMSMYKRELTEREEDRRLFFREQQLIREAYLKEEAERLKREANAYSYALKQCGLL